MRRLGGAIRHRTSAKANAKKKDGSEKAQKAQERQRGLGGRVLMGRYDDLMLHQEMLLRIVVEDAADEMVVVTGYKTSQVQRYLKGLLP